MDEILQVLGTIIFGIIILFIVLIELYLIFGYAIGVYSRQGKSDFFGENQGLFIEIIKGWVLLHGIILIIIGVIALVIMAFPLFLFIVGLILTFGLSLIVVGFLIKVTFELSIIVAFYTTILFLFTAFFGISLPFIFYILIIAIIVGLYIIWLGMTAHTINVLVGCIVVCLMVNLIFYIFGAALFGKYVIIQLLFYILGAILVLSLATLIIFLKGSSSIMKIIAFVILVIFCFIDNVFLNQWPLNYYTCIENELNCSILIKYRFEDDSIEKQTTINSNENLCLFSEKSLIVEYLQCDSSIIENQIIEKGSLLQIK